MGVTTASLAIIFQGAFATDHEGPNGGQRAESVEKMVLTYLGALAPNRALVVSGERALENECQRCH